MTCTQLQIQTDPLRSEWLSGERVVIFIFNGPLVEADDRGSVLPWQGGIPSVTPSQPAETLGFFPSINRNTNRNSDWHVTDGVPVQCCQNPSNPVGCDGVTDRSGGYWRDSAPMRRRTDRACTLLPSSLPDGCCRAQSGKDSATERQSSG